MVTNAPVLRLDGVRFGYRGGWRLGVIEAEVGSDRTGDLMSLAGDETRQPVEAAGTGDNK